MTNDNNSSSSSDDSPPLPRSKRRSPPHMSITSRSPPLSFPLPSQLQPQPQPQQQQQQQQGSLSSRSPPSKHRHFPSFLPSPKRFHSSSSSSSPSSSTSTPSLQIPTTLTPSSSPSSSKRKGSLLNSFRSISPSPTPSSSPLLSNPPNQPNLQIRRTSASSLSLPPSPRHAPPPTSKTPPLPSSSSSSSPPSPLLPSSPLLPPSSPSLDSPVLASSSSFSSSSSSSLPPPSLLPGSSSSLLSSKEGGESELEEKGQEEQREEQKESEEKTLKQQSEEKEEKEQEEKKEQKEHRHHLRPRRKRKNYNKWLVLASIFAISLSLSCFLFLMSPILSPLENQLEEKIDNFFRKEQERRGGWGGEGECECKGAKRVSRVLVMIILVLLYIIYHLLTKDERGPTLPTLPIGPEVLQTEVEIDVREIKITDSMQISFYAGTSTEIAVIKEDDTSVCYLETDENSKLMTVTLPLDFFSTPSSSWGKKKKSFHFVSKKALASYSSSSSSPFPCPPPLLLVTVEPPLPISSSSSASFYSSPLSVSSEGDDGGEKKGGEKLKGKGQNLNHPTSVNVWIDQNDYLAQTYSVFGAPKMISIPIQPSTTAESVRPKLMRALCFLSKIRSDSEEFKRLSTVTKSWDLVVAKREGVSRKHQTTLDKSEIIWRYRNENFGIGAVSEDFPTEKSLSPNRSLRKVTHLSQTKRKKEGLNSFLAFRLTEFLQFQLDYPRYSTRSSAFVGDYYKVEMKVTNEKTKEEITTLSMSDFQLLIRHGNDKNEEKDFFVLKGGDDSQRSKGIYSFVWHIEITGYYKAIVRFANFAVQKKWAKLRFRKRRWYEQKNISSPDPSLVSEMTQQSLKTKGVKSRFKYSSPHTGTDNMTFELANSEPLNLNKIKSSSFQRGPLKIKRIKEEESSDDSDIDQSDYSSEAEGGRELGESVDEENSERGKEEGEEGGEEGGRERIVPSFQSTDTFISTVQISFPLDRGLGVGSSVAEEVGGAWEEQRKDKEKEEK